MLIPIRNTKDFVCVSESLKFIAQNVVEGKIILIILRWKFVLTNTKHRNILAHFEFHKSKKLIILNIDKCLIISMTPAISLTYIE